MDRFLRRDALQGWRKGHLPADSKRAADRSAVHGGFNFLRDPPALRCHILSMLPTSIRAIKSSNFKREWYHQVQ